MSSDPSIAPFYEGWSVANTALIRALERLSPEQLQLPVGSPEWPVWASAAHLAGARVFWLCSIFGEPGADTTPFTDPSGYGWEDDLAHPRGAEELVHALESTWRIVERCLATWTPAMLSDEAIRMRGTEKRIHTRQSVLMRIITHDAYHAGEISLTLGAHGLGDVDLWRDLSRTAD